jgi:hypothetical protein
VEVRVKVLKGVVIKISILSLHIITVALVVISALIAFRYVLRNLEINNMCLGKMNLVLRTKSRPLVIKSNSLMKGLEALPLMRRNLPYLIKVRIPPINKFGLKRKITYVWLLILL